MNAKDLRYPPVSGLDRYGGLGSNSATPTEGSLKLPHHSGTVGDTPDETGKR